ILIEKIYPIVNKKHKLYRSELDSFDISRIFCIEKKIGKCKELSQYRTSFTYLLVAKNLPGLCRLVEAFIVFTYEKGPVEHGCDSISLGSQQLKSTQNNALLTKDLGTLIMKLQGIVAAGVNGGIANYESFFTEMFLKGPENLSQKPFLEKLKTLLIEQSTVLASSISTCMSLATTETEFKTAISLNSGFKEYQIQLINCFKVNPNSLKKSLGVMYYENFDPKFIPARFKKVEDDQPSGTLKLRGTLTIGSMKNKSKRASKLKS
ncbi:MAG: Dedicator of cytokinesis protein 3, partial [Paramarteilia canceri]